MEREGELLFVYGTLKRGLANHHQLGGAPFVGEAELPGVQLHDLGPFPMAIPGEGPTRGELYRVDADRLAHLDRFEGVPRLYRRACLRLRDGQRVWVYLGSPRQVRCSPRLEAGRWPPGAPAGAMRPGADPGPMPAVTPRQAMAADRRRWLLLLALLAPVPWAAMLPARAEASLAQCQRWQQSSGAERIRLGNAIGAAAYLTKPQRFAESDPQQPRLLYAPSDLQRLCAGWR